MTTGLGLTLIRRLALVCVGALALAACAASEIPKQLKPVPNKLVSKMQKLGMKETGQIFVRIFKESSELEVWKETEDGTYALLTAYDVCKWSGVLGPKTKEGDRQAPEGFYTVAPAQMNPNSAYYLSFNIGYPNAFDKALGRTGRHLMVHGACSSAGCYSMTDEAAGEIFSLARDAFKGGQRAFQIQALPFRMTPENMARHRDNPNMAFWRTLKEGNDHFELTKRPPKVDVCDRRYIFNADAGGAKFDPTGACPAYQVPPALAAALAVKQATDDEATALVVARLEAEEKLEASSAPVQVASAPVKVSARTRLARLLGRRTRAPQGPATPVSLERTAPLETTLVASATAVPVIVPLPAPRPTRVSAVAPVQPPVQPPVLIEPVANMATSAFTAANPDTIGQPIPTVGRFIKRPFNWYDDG